MNTHADAMTTDEQRLDSLFEYMRSIDCFKISAVHPQKRTAACMAFLVCVYNYILEGRRADGNPLDPGQKADLLKLFDLAWKTRRADIEEFVPVQRDAAVYCRPDLETNVKLH